MPLLLAILKIIPNKIANIIIVAEVIYLSIILRYIAIKQNKEEQKSIIASDSESGNIKAFSMAIISKVEKIISEKKKRVFFCKECS